MHHIFLCDDDPLQTKLLLPLIERIVGGNAVISSCTSVDALIQLLHKVPEPSIVFMDIKLDNGICGIDVVKQLFPEGSGVQVIYITGYMEYCTRVYETEHISFLVKPIKPAELTAALERALLKASQSTRKGIVIKVGTEIRFLPFSQLRFLESHGRKTYFFCGDQIYESYIYLKDAIKALDDRFYQCHKSFAVNLDWVTACNGKDYALTTDEQIPISNRYRPDAKERFLRHLGETLPF